MSKSKSKFKSHWDALGWSEYMQTLHSWRNFAGRSGEKLFQPTWGCFLQRGQTIPNGRAKSVLISSTEGNGIFCWIKLLQSKLFIVFMFNIFTFILCICLNEDKIYSKSQWFEKRKLYFCLLLACHAECYIIQSYSWRMLLKASEKPENTKMDVSFHRSSVIGKNN